MDSDGFHCVGKILKAGIYLLVLRGRVVYVGKSRGMLTRVYTHQNLARRNYDSKILPIKGVKFDDVWVRPCLVDELDTLEQRFIDKYNPPLNKQLKRLKAAPLPISVGGISFTLTPKERNEVRRRV